MYVLVLFFQRKQRLHADSGENMGWDPAAEHAEKSQVSV